MNFLCQGFGIVWQTDKHTESTEIRPIVNHAASRVVSNLNLQEMFICCILDEEHDPDVEYTAWIREHYVFLLDNLDSVFSGLIGYLYQHEVFDRAERDDEHPANVCQAERTSSVHSRSKVSREDQHVL